MISYKEVEGIFATLKDRAADEPTREMLDIILSRHAGGPEFCKIVAEQLGIDAKEFSSALNLYGSARCRPYYGFTDAHQDILDDRVWNNRAFDSVHARLKFK